MNGFLVNFPQGISLMKTMKTAFIAPIATLALAASSVSAATVLLDNKNSAGLVTANSQSTFGGQSFTLSVAGVGTNDTVTANSPIPANATLNSITFVKAPLGTATAGSLFVKIFTGSADASGTPVAVSTNGIDINNATALSDLVFAFAGESLSTSTQYFAVFSTNGLTDATGTDLVGGRVAAANFGTGFNSTYSGGVGFSSANPPAGTTLDARFAVSFDVVPEPSVALLGGLGMLALLRRRRA